MTDLQDPYGVDDQTSSPMSGRGFILSAALIALVVIAGIVVVTLNLVDDDEPSPNPPPAPSTSASTSAPSDPEASVCGLTERKDSGGLVAAPTPTDWDLNGKVALPSSPAHGPGVTEQGARYCYSRTPEGALFAAANTFGWQTAGDLQKALTHSVAAGDGQKAAGRLLEGIDPSTDLTQGGLVQVRGFRVLAYSGDSALVDVVVQVTAAETTALSHTEFELLWEEGDWRVRLAPDGSVPRAEVVPDMTGYVPWAGA